MTDLLIFGHSACIPELKSKGNVHIKKVCMPEWQEAWGGCKPSEDTYLVSNIGDLHLIIDTFRPDVGLCVGSQWIFKDNFLDKFPQGFFNLHPSILPKYAGAGGVSWQTLGGECMAGVTIHKMTNQIDRGEICVRQEAFVGFTANNPERSELIQKLTKKAIDEFIHKVDTKTLTLSENKLRTYLPALRAHTNGAIDWNWSTDEIVRFCNAFDKPHAGAFTYYEGEKVVLTDVTAGAVKSPHPFMAGLLSDYGIILTRDGSIKCNISKKDLKVGSRLWTPQNKLDEARTYRP